VRAILPFEPYIYIGASQGKWAQRVILAMVAGSGGLARIVSRRRFAIFGERVKVLHVQHAPERSRGESSLVLKTLP